MPNQASEEPATATPARRRGDGAEREARDNAWVASRLRELSARIALADGSYRSKAYQRAADAVGPLGRSLEAMREEGEGRGLESIPGVGPKIAAAICELLDTGTTRRLDQLRRRAPVDVLALLDVDGLGAKTLKRLWEELKIRNLEDLDEALRTGRVEALRGFGPRRCSRLRRAVAIKRGGGGRIPHARATRVAERLLRRLIAHPDVVDCAIAGSLRRGEAHVGDIDIVAATREPAAVAALLLQQPGIEHVYSRGPRRVSVRLREGIDVDLRTITPDSYGSALLYFTGNRAHHVALRRLALAQGLHLNEYGLFCDGERIAGTSERDIYEALSLPYVPPERRRGESELRDALHRVRDPESRQRIGSTPVAR